MEKVIPEESFKKGKKKFSRQTQVEWQGRSEGDRRNSSCKGNRGKRRWVCLGAASSTDLWRVRPGVRENQTGRREVAGSLDFT